MLHNNPERPPLCLSAEKPPEATRIPIEMSNAPNTANVDGYSCKRPRDHYKHGDDTEPSDLDWVLAQLEKILPSVLGRAIVAGIFALLTHQPKTSQNGMQDSLHLLRLDGKQKRRKELRVDHFSLHDVAQVVGRRIEKIDPFGDLGDKLIDPPCASTAHLAIASPRPAPPASRVRPSSIR